MVPSKPPQAPRPNDPLDPIGPDDPFAVNTNFLGTIISGSSLAAQRSPLGDVLTEANEFVNELTLDPDVAAFKECFIRPGAYTDFVTTLQFRRTAEHGEQSAEPDSNAFGTRAKGTDRLVYRILQSPEYRTVEIVTRFLEEALPTAKRKTLPARAKNILDRIEKYGESGIPKNELDLVSWSDLEVTGIAVKGERRRRTRHFKPCTQCGVRFLAKRSDQEFHNPKCRVRWNRFHPPVTDNCTEPSGTRINIDENEAIFTVPPIME